MTLFLASPSGQTELTVRPESGIVVTNIITASIMFSRPGRWLGLTVGAHHTSWDFRTGAPASHPEQIR